MKKNILYIMLSVLLCFACQSESITEGTGSPNEDVSKRELTHITFVASLADTAATRVAYSQGSEALARHWEVNEQLGVYIKNNSTGAITRAGSITSTGSTTDVTREFSGNVTKVGSGESYIYMHPDLINSVDNPASGSADETIDFTSQSGSLGSTDHLKSLIPMVWRNGNTIGEMQGYVVHLVLTFKENPGTITSVSLQTMKMGEAGTTEDRVFPASFKTANLGNDVNSTLATEKTRGTALASDADYANTITLTTSGTATGPATDGSYTTEAYLACADIKNLDVFRSKYNVKVETESNGTFYSDFKSFPGQASANSANGLPMLSNGKMYKLSAKMSKNYSTTIISDNFKVNSLLGMWNQYGKGYDPQSLVVTDASNWPTSLQAAIGDAGKQTSVKSRITSSNTSGTPNWLGPANGSLYATGQTDLKQENVSFNNIKITANTEVFLTIVSEFGWNQNLLGYYYYPTANEGSVTSSSVTKTIVFADVSKPEHEPFAKGMGGSHKDGNSVGTPAQAPIQEFETVKLVYTDEYGYSSTTFPAGTTIGFWMMIDPEANIIVTDDGSSVNGYNHRQYDLMRWSQWRLFTNSAWNAENTFANGSSANWPSTGYVNCNFFASGDVCNGSGNPIQGLAIYGVKDNGTNNYNYAYGAMIFMVSTSVPTAMTTENKAYFNIGTGSLVIAK